MSHHATNSPAQSGDGGAAQPRKQGLPSADGTRLPAPASPPPCSAYAARMHPAARMQRVSTTTHRAGCSRLRCSPPPPFPLPPLQRQRAATTSSRSRTQLDGSVGVGVEQLHALPHLRLVQLWSVARAAEQGWHRGGGRDTQGRLAAAVPDVVGLALLAGRGGRCVRPCGRPAHRPRSGPPHHRRWNSSRDSSPLSSASKAVNTVCQPRGAWCASECGCGRRGLAACPSTAAAADDRAPGSTQPSGALSVPSPGHALQFQRPADHQCRTLMH